MNSLPLLIASIVGVVSGPCIMLTTPEKYELLGDLAGGLIFVICMSIGINSALKKHKKLEVTDEA